MQSGRLDLEIVAIVPVRAREGWECGRFGNLKEILDCSAGPIGHHYDDAGHADLTADEVTWKLVWMLGASSPVVRELGTYVLL